MYMANFCLIGGGLLVPTSGRLAMVVALRSVGISICGLQISMFECCFRQSVAGCVGCASGENLRHCFLSL